MGKAQDKEVMFDKSWNRKGYKKQNGNDPYSMMSVFKERRDRVNIRSVMTGC
jgi:hypothetical protein